MTCYSGTGQTYHLAMMIRACSDWLVVCCRFNLIGQLIGGLAASGFAVSSFGTGPNYGDVSNPTCLLTTHSS